MLFWETVIFVSGIVIGVLGVWGTFFTSKKTLGIIALFLGVIAIIAYVCLKNEIGINITKVGDKKIDSSKVVIVDTNKPPPPPPVPDTTKKFRLVGEDIYEVFDKGVSKGLIYIPSDAIKFSVFDQQRKEGKNTGELLCDVVTKTSLLNNLGKYITTVLNKNNKLLVSMSNGKLLPNKQEDWTIGGSAMYGLNLDNMKSSKMSYKWNPGLNKHWTVKEWLDYADLK